MPVDVIVAWVWIFAGALVSAVGMLLAYRRAGAGAIYVYVGGLLLLAVSAFRVHPALVRFSLPPDVQILQDELSEANRKVSIEYDRLAAANARIRELEASSKITERDLAVTRTSASDCLAANEKEIAANKERQLRIDKDAADLESLSNKLLLVSGERRALSGQLEALKEDHRSTLQSYETKENLLAANVHHLRLVETERSTLAAQLSEKDQELAAAREIIAQMKEQLTNIKSPEAPPRPPRVEFIFGGTSKFDIQKLENGEMVQGEVGDYYLITFKEPKTLSPITFPSASFVITDKAEELRSAMQEMHEDVLQRIPSNWRYKIFVRGHADGGSFKEPLGDEGYRNLEYLPPSGTNGSNYLAQVVSKRLATEYENEDLPNLRGAYLARTLLETLKGEAPVLLGNSPEPGSNIANRRAEVILFLRQPSE